MAKLLILAAVIVVVALVVALMRAALGGSSSRGGRTRRRSEPPYTFVPLEPLKVTYGPRRRNAVPLPPGPPGVRTPIYDLLVHAAFETDPKLVDRILLNAVQQAEDPTSKTPPADLFNARYARALWLIEQGRYADAEALLVRFGRHHDPDHVLVLCALVTVCIKRNNLERAEFFAQQVMPAELEEQFPYVLDVVMALHELAEANRRKFCFAEARLFYQGARQVACQRDAVGGIARTIALEKLVEFECRQQNWAEAARVYDLLRDNYAAQTNPCDKPDLLDRCVTMLQQVGRSDEAGELAKRAANARREQMDVAPAPAPGPVLTLKVLPRLPRPTQPQS